MANERGFCNLFNASVAHAQKISVSVHDLCAMCELLPHDENKQYGFQ